MDYEQKPKKWRDLGLQDRAVILLTFGILVVAGVTATILKNQFGEMDLQTKLLATQMGADSVSASLSAIQVQKQLTTAQQQMQAAEDSVKAIQLQTWQDQRAWVTVDVGEETGNFSVRMHNTGRSPALNVTYTVAFTGAKLGVIPEIDLTKANSSSPLPKNLPQDVLDRLKREGLIGDHPPTGYVIAPNKSEIASYYGGKFSEAFPFNADRVYIQGRISYDDVFGRQHETRFCYWYAASSAFPMCNDHNKMN